MVKEPFIDFQGMWVLVSGASSGMGRAISVELSRRGAKLILLGRKRETLEETASLVRDSEVQFIVLDLRAVDEISNSIKEFGKKIGKIYGLCHSAGVVETRPLAAIKRESLRELLDINLIAGIELAKAVTRRDVMVEGGGSIVFISSVYGNVGVAGQIGYCGSKGAVTSAARAMAIELARRNIRVNSLSPGLVMTPMTDSALKMLSEKQIVDLKKAYPLGTGTPEDVARAAVFLLAPQNRWITGVDLVIDGGYSAQ